MKQGAIIKTFKSKKGNAVVFRSLRSRDLNDMLAFANALIREDTFIGLSGQPLTRAEEQKHLDDALKRMKSGDLMHVVVEINGVFAGSAELRRNPMRRKKHVGEIGISLLAAYRNEGIGRELMNTLIHEAKKKDFRLVELTCFENNPRALHLYEKIGFRRVGIIPEAILYKNEYVNEIVLYLPLVEA